jgi:hypothetical protein
VTLKTKTLQYVETSLAPLDQSHRRKSWIMGGTVERDCCISPIEATFAVRCACCRVQPLACPCVSAVWWNTVCSSVSIVTSYGLQDPAILLLPKTSRPPIGLTRVGCFLLCKGGHSAQVTSNLHQYNETNVMHFLFNLLRINVSTCFKHYLLILRRRCTSRTWCIVCVLFSVGCSCPSAAYLAPPEVEQVMLETCRDINS